MYRALVPALIILHRLVPAAAQEPSDFVWQLKDLDAYRPTGNPYKGQQNLTWCCTRAVQESLEVENGSLVIRPDHRNWIVPSNASLLANATSAQFPCTATYTGDDNGSPVVQVPYEWLTTHCPGWQISGGSNLNGWLQPLAGFLVPAVIFCLSVPRRRRLGVPRRLFSPDLARASSYLGAVPSAILAGFIVLTDTIIWLGICFAFAGPMILSGMYEAMLDSRVLAFVREKVDNHRLTVDMRCRLLIIILIGNLDMALDPPEMLQREDITNEAELALTLTEHSDANNGAWRNNGESDIQLESSISRENDDRPSSIKDSSRDIERSSGSPLPTSRDVLGAPETRYRGRLHSNNRPPPIDSNRQDFNERQKVVRQPTDELRPSPWRHMEELLYNIRDYDDDDLTRQLSPRQAPTVDKMAQVPQPSQPRSKTVQKRINKNKTRLRAMLHCQHSFGFTVGAPVVFFLGGFIFALIQSLASLGDEEIALALAFGQWYMIIPHTAIVSSLLLAGNNPNILEGVFATERDDTDIPPRFMGLSFELSYPSIYKVSWQWLRGTTKRSWIKQLIDTYKVKGASEDLEKLQNLITLSLDDWILILGLTVLLLDTPFVLAFITAYYTPPIGISCRALTVLICFSAQAAQILLWLWAYAGPPRNQRLLPTRLVCRDGWLDRHGFYNPTVRPPVNLWSSGSFHSVICAVWYSLAALVGLIAAVAALGGTLMQLLGVYTANVCKLIVNEWILPVGQCSMAELSYNSKLRIQMAQTRWVGSALGGIAFMTIVSFTAWWYQRRMRDIFVQLVRAVDQ